MECRVQTQLSEGEAARFDDFVMASQHGSLFQTTPWARAREPRPGVDYWFATFTDASKLVGCALGRRRRLPLVSWCTDHVERGPVCDDAERLADCVSLLAQTLSGHGSTGVTVGPYWTRADAATVEERLANEGFRPLNEAGGWTDYASLDIDLSVDEGDLLKGFSASTRRWIRKAERLGVRVSNATNSEDIAEFVALYAEMADIRGIRALGLPQMLFLAEHFREHPGHGTILLSRLGDELLAGLVVLRHGGRAEYTYGASLWGEFRHVPKSHLGVWRAIQWAQAAGCSVFDLGGIHPTAPEGSAIASINQFKRGFSTHQIELLPPYEKSLRPVRRAVVETAQKVAARRKRRAF